jgi:hypothetical protein
MENMIQGLKTLVELSSSNKRCDFLVRFDILRQFYPDCNIPEISDNMTDNKVESLYLETVNMIQIECNERNAKREEMLKSLNNLDESSEVYRDTIRKLMKQLTQEDVDDDKLSEFIKIYKNNICY